jgi:hypothetical protein
MGRSPEMSNNDMKMGLGVVALMALCCGAPLILALFASGVVLGGLGTVWAGGRLLLLLLGGGALVVAAAWLLTRRRTPGTGDGADCCAAPTPPVDTNSVAAVSPPPRPSIVREQVPVESGRQDASR